MHALQAAILRMLLQRKEWAAAAAFIDAFMRRWRRAAEGQEQPPAAPAAATDLQALLGQVQAALQDAAVAAAGLTAELLGAFAALVPSLESVQVRLGAALWGGCQNQTLGSGGDGIPASL